MLGEHVFLRGSCTPRTPLFMRFLCAFLQRTRGSSLEVSLGVREQGQPEKGLARTQVFISGCPEFAVDEGPGGAALHSGHYAGNNVFEGYRKNSIVGTTVQEKRYVCYIS